MLMYKRGLWHKLAGWQERASSCPGAFRTAGGVWIVTSHEFAHQILVNDTGSYPVTPAFLRANGRSLPKHIRVRTVQRLLRLMTRTQWTIDPDHLARMIRNPQHRQFQSWGLWFMREAYRSSMSSIHRPPVFDALIDRFVKTILIDGTTRGRRIVPQRTVFLAIQRDIATEFANISTTESHISDLIDVVNNLGRSLTAMDSAELYLRLITALLGATGTALEWTVILSAQAAAINGPLNHGELHRAALETQRLYPSSWRLARESRRANTLGTHSIQTGDQIIVATSVIHRDPALWSNAQSFMPERWLHGTAIPGGAYLPFSTGPGICPGRAVAMEAIRRGTEMILRSFAVEARFTKRARPQALSLLAPPRGELHITEARQILSTT
jgi:hypothetical protein